MAIVVTGDSPHLYVHTVSLPSPIPVAQRIPPHATAVWLHGHGGFVALGHARRLEASGPGRFADLARDFADLTRRARVRDDVRSRGTGLIAFGSFSYADNSPRPSRLLIPRAILGTIDGASFLTVISDTDTGPLTRHGIEAALAEYTPTAEFPPTPGAARHPSEMTPAHSADSYRALVATAVDRINRGDAQKIVLSERFTVDLDGEGPRPLLPSLARHLNARYRGAWTFHIDDIIGASPEMLVRTDAGAIFSRVLAGSRPVAGDGSLNEHDRRAFLADPKERAEHDYAVRSVAEPLARLTDDLSVSPTPFVLQLPGLEHLASDITGRLASGVGLLDVAEALHPSAAVSGTPREVANAIIADLEGVDRGGYAAPVGWIGGAGDGEWAIALRMAHVGEDSLTIQAGGGLVTGSDPLTEHAEALAKTRPIMSALAATDRPGSPRPGAPAHPDTP
ncbi:MAG: chorismate-binding protein [Dermabacter sp.]|nr:chorismate-binding protein [Dermabacter sp.]